VYNGVASDFVVWVGPGLSLELHRALGKTKAWGWAPCILLHYSFRDMVHPYAYCAQKCDHITLQELGYVQLLFAAFILVLLKYV